MGAHSTAEGATGVPLGLSGIEASVGDHIAHFYRGSDQRVDVLAPYLQIGLGRGDKCVVIASPSTGDALCERLEENGIDVAAARESGQFVVHSGKATEEEMHALADHIERDARGEGYDFVRWAGDGDWALAGDASVCEMLRWEALYDQCSTGWEMIALCQFNIDAFGGDVIMDAMRAHPYCIMGDVVVPNPFHESPEVLLDELPDC